MLIPHIEGDSILIRHRHDDRVNGHLKIRPTHVILAGNGAIEGGTAPLVQAIAEITGRLVADRAAASVAAVLAQEYKGRKYFALKDLSEILDNVGSLDAYLADYYSFKSSLANHYMSAFEGGSLKLRESIALEEVVTTVSPSDVGVITINWDPCFWEAARFENVIQLHGLAHNPVSIVLPGEYASDEEVAEVLHNLGFSIQDDSIREQVQRMFRGDFRRPLTASLQTAGMWLDGASTIAVWGLGFHAYDSEVCQLAWYVGRESRERKQIVVINPSETDREICKFLFSSPQFQFAEFPA